MSELIVQVVKREEQGKNASRRLRARGQIPAVVYGHGVEATPVTVNPKEVDRILHSETGRNTIFKLEMAGSRTDVLIRDFQLDPVMGNLLHADFQAVAMDEAMVFEVPVQIEGTARGVIQGGILDTVLREIEVECLPGDVPDHFHVDVHELEIGDSIRVQDLQIDTAKLTLLSEPELVVVTVVPPHVEAEPEVEVAKEEAEEPELIKKGKTEAQAGEAEPARGEESEQE